MMKAFWMGTSIGILVCGFIITAIGIYTGQQGLEQLGYMNMALGAVLVAIRLHEGDNV
jgi:uncharacterized membrane protein YiaA